MSKKTVAFALFLLSFGTTIWAQQDPFGTPDTIRLGNYQAYPHSSFSIPIFLYNDEPLMGLTLPLVLWGDTGAVRCDSVVFDHGRTGRCQFRGVRIDNVSKSVLIGIVPSLDSAQLYIEPGSGEVARVYFTYTGSPESGVDTLTSGPLPPFNTLKFVGANITPFTPEFVYGLIELLPTGVSQSDTTILQELEIRAYPNPSNSSVNLEIYLPSEGEYRLQIFNILGQELLERSYLGRAGFNSMKIMHEYAWSSGIYLLRVAAGNQYRHVRLLLLK